MRLLFPERFSLVSVFYFAGLLCAIQQFQGTDSTFSLCCFAYILVAAVAFNIAGGFTRTTGAFIFFNSVLGVIIGLCMKAYLDEPADSNLQSPVLTMTVYLAGMCMMLVAALLSRRFATKRALLGKMVTDVNMQTATVGSMITGLFLYFSGFLFTGGNGTVWSALNQLNRFIPMAIMLGILNTIRRTRGARSINLPVLLSASFLFLSGVLNFSKEAMFTPFVCWLLVASSQRFRVSRPQILGIGVATFIIFYYLVPYSQYEMISIDDALDNHTKQFGTFGFYPVIQSLENVVPHFIWPDKPPLLTGNTYAHEVGLLSEGDDSTGVSFSSTAVAFHLMGWYGVFLLAPFLWFLLFTVFDSLCGDVRKSPWGLLVMVLFAHAAPEGDLNSVIYMIFYGAFGIIFAAVMGAYVMPVIGTFFIGPEGIALRRGAQIRSIGGRLLPLARRSQARPSQG
jgi:hypothetical protein